MIAQRVGTAALRRVAATPYIFSQNLAKAITPLASSSLSTTQQTRFVATTKLTPSDAQSRLVAQRLNRPVSPHLAIYDKEQTFLVSSIWTRITGGLLSAGLYAAGFAYLAAPALGWHLDSASLASLASGLPAAVKASAKFLLSWPFCFHALYGVRHILFDFGVGFAKSTVLRERWVWFGASMLAALGLVTFY